MLSPAIFAQLQNKVKDPNDEPFLPIHPVYPYNPKLIKRGTEGKIISQVTSEVHAPKIDAKDSYSSSYSNQRNSYSPTTTYSRTSSPSPAYSSYYNNDPYAYDTSHYAIYGSYPTPYAINPSYPASMYPNYYYQPYYYPQYFNPAPFPPPPPSQSSVDYEMPQDSSAESEDDKEKKSKNTKEDETNQNALIGRFVDGRNYISSSSRDLDGQSSTYKIPNPYNQLAQDVEVKNLPIPLPKTTYRVISVGGQPVGPDYPLPASYVKAQQVEQLMSQTLATLLAQNAQQQATQLYEIGKDTSNGSSDGSYASQDVSYSSNTLSSYVPSVSTKPGVTYVTNTDDIGKIHGERAETIQDSSSQSSTNKNAKYSNGHYVRKPALQALYYMTSDNRNNKSRGRVISNHRPVDQTNGYDSYDASQNYSGTYSQTGNNKQEQTSYGSYQSQPAVSYQTKNLAVSPQASRSYSYQYSSDQQTQQQQDKTVANSSNFGAKENKG